MTETGLSNEIKNEVLQLTGFADFLKQFGRYAVSNVKYLDQIKEDLQNDLPSKRANYWDMRLQIIDAQIQEGKTERRGAWCRQWVAFFENNCLEVYSATLSTEDKFPDGERDFQLIIDYSSGKVYRSGSTIEGFLKDAEEYKKYITEHINEIEMDADYFL